MSNNHDNPFEKLETGNKEMVERLKQNIREQFAKVQEPWLINGWYDYYLSTNSVRCMEVLLSLRDPHQQFLFDRICESIKSRKTDLKVRVQALTLLGHIAQSQHTWLFTLPEHPLFKELLSFLMNETELLPLISALLVLIVLLPMFPSYIGTHYLDDIFGIFRRLAAWNSHIPGKLVEDQMIHLQVALYALFLRLYGMFPCNFLAYLRCHFKDKNNPVFCHTIKPMMDTVKMHPSLVITSKESETSTERWKKMGVHDVIVECERFSLDITDRCPHETCQNTTEFRSRSGTMNSTVGSSTAYESYHQQNLKSLAALQMSGNEDGNFFSPSDVYTVQAPSTSNLIQYIPMSQEGSPPEAAIEATPETTPIRDFNDTPATTLSTKTNVARALNTFRTNSSGGAFIVAGTPASSIPSSPMRKDQSSFVFPQPTTLQHLASRLAQERQQQQVGESFKAPVPSSPLKILNADVSRQRPESPMSQEDEEVLSISKNFQPTTAAARACDSVLPDFDDSDQPTNEDVGVEHGSPCAAGGLHMPNSKSINNFKKRIRRFRYHSQCNPEPERMEMSTGSSPGNGLPFVSNSNVRRANSCPDIKKSPHPPSKDPKKKPFYETDEETVSEDQVSTTSNGLDGANSIKKQKFRLINSCTQTEVFWPMPYEHLFFNIFPSLKDEGGSAAGGEIKPSPAPSPALHQTVESYKPSLYDILDKYIEKSVSVADNSNNWGDQVQLIHQQFLFERHRRETHAYRNRRLLSDAKNTRLLEEYNSALRDQVQLAQKEIDKLRNQLEDYRSDVIKDQREMANNLQFMKDMCKRLTDENDSLKQQNGKLGSEVAVYKTRCNSLDKERQEVEANLLDALVECKVAKEQAMGVEKLKLQLNRVNTELLLLGELHVKCRDKLDDFASVKQSEDELRQIREAYSDELKILQRQLETKTTLVDACRARVSDLDHVLALKDEVIMAQKRALAAANEERESVLETVESKYQTQLAINRTLEERLLEMQQRLEAETARRRTHSPDTSSCHEVQATSATTTAAGGFSPQHSSPLSGSLASSEGSAALQELKLQQYDGSSNLG